MTAECSPTQNVMDNLNLPNNIDSLCGPENLVICMDSYACLNTEFKKILRNFLELKNLVNRHEVAFAVLTGSDVKFLSDFQQDVNKSTYNHIWQGYRFNSEQSHYHNQPDSFDISKVFKQVYQYCTRSHSKIVSLRVIIVYARVDCMPVIEDRCVLENLEREYPCFTLDLLYTPQYNEKSSKITKKQERQQAQNIFKALIDICNSKSYVFAVDESNKVAACVLKFLAHPALRESQKPDWFE